MNRPHPQRRPDSVLQSLRRTYGSSVDPHIRLVQDEQPARRARSAEDADGASGESSGVLSRLKARGLRSQRYRLDGEIGRGGMGAVLEVWDEDLRRSLAMKVALGSERGSTSASTDKLDPKLLARFLEEAQVTGQLEHPGIVPVHELGVDEEGQAYFTMRLVRGRDLEEVFELVSEEGEGWSLTRALGVLLKVCEAMAYAHSKGVIHRDLKPANVMVGSFGEVYVMDWGLVRVRGYEDRHDVRISAERSGLEPEIDTDRREDASGLSRDELYTMDGDIIGTPAYMSPEQARGELEALDARADVYALGAMLYRLIAGVTPYGRAGERRGAAAILGDLLDGPPVELEKLEPSAPPELVAICTKAMARERTERYRGMLALAEDLRAYLENRVVQAYETGAWAEARKWVRRNRPLAVSLAAGLLALVAGLVASWILKGRADQNAILAEERRVAAVGSAAEANAARLEANEARGEAELAAAAAELSAQEARDAAALAEERRHEADRSAEEARRQARIAEEVAEFLNEDLLTSVAPENRGIDVTVREALDAASMRLMRFANEPLIEAELRWTIGSTYERLGAYEKAERNLQRSLDLRREALGNRDEGTLQSMISLAATWLEAGRAREAYDLFGEAHEILLEDRGPHYTGTLAAKNDLALAAAGLGRLDEALGLMEEVLDEGERADGELPAKSRRSLGNLGGILSDLGRYEKAEETLRRALELSRRYDGSRHPETLRTMGNLADVLSQAGKLDESEDLQTEILRVQESLLGESHPDVGVARSNLAELYLRQGKALKARRYAEQAVEQLTTSLGEDHQKTLLARNNLAVAYSSTGRVEQALQIREQLLEDQRRVLGPEHPDTLTTLDNLAVLYRSFDRFAEAEDLQREALRLNREVFGPNHPKTLTSLENLGGLLFMIEDYEGSLEITREVLEARKVVLGDTHPDVAKTTYNMGMIAKVNGDFDLAVETFREAVQRFERDGGSPQNLAETHMQLGNLHMDADRFAEAIVHYGNAEGVLSPLGDSEERGYVLHQIAFASYEMGDLEGAAEVGARAWELRRRHLGADHPNTLATLFTLAKYHELARRFDEAEPLALEYHERKSAALPADHRDLQLARKLLRGIYEEMGNLEEAEKWR